LPVLAGQAREATFSQYVGYIPFGQQQMTGLLKVPTKAQSCQDGRGHDFGIGHLTLGILVMMKSFRHIVT
jgi:hypothetical protein